MRAHRSLIAVLSCALTSACFGGDPADPRSDPETPTFPGTRPDFPAGTDPYRLEVPEWVVTATVGSLELYREMSEAELDGALAERKAEHVSVLEIDTRLSQYLSDQAFGAEVSFLDHAAAKAHQLDMKAVIYYPALEVLTPDAVNSPSSMYKDHPDWVQLGLSGEPNVFYGTLEHWVDPGTESAWMSPNSGYRDYFLERIRALAGTALDGVWVDVPVYLETGVAWPGAEPPAAEAFRAWSIASGEASAPGYDVPRAADFDDPIFRAWIRWRHVNIRDFLEDIRAAAHEVNPEFMVIIEAFPVDNVDATSVGLDGPYRVSGKNFIRVWEIDSVSNTRAMQWANHEDFDSKIAMNKWARAMERGNPAWAFSYGYQPLDAGLVLAAAAATGVVPFECQTPDMTKSVDTAFRTRWFSFLREHADAILATERHAEVAVWYSSPTRDYLDYPVGGSWGMYINTENPGNVPEWWADAPEDSALPKPHLGGWRGAAHAMTRLGIPFEVVAEPGDPSTRLAKVKLLWLPSVAAMSEASAAAIREFVSGGGVVLATGYLPATLDETGRARAESALADVFGVGADAAGPRMNRFGEGLAIFRPDLAGNRMYAGAGDPDEAADTLSAVEALLRVHVPDVVRFDVSPGVHVEVARPRPEQHFLYVVNYTGLKQPAVANVIDLPIGYRAPEGWRVASAKVVTPDAAGQRGPLAVEVSGGMYQLKPRIDQFALIELALEPVEEPVSPHAGPSFDDPAWGEAAESGLQFILEKMRPIELPEPLRFGVFTNLIDDEGLTEIYAHGHSVTAEHMGLLLRASACMGNQTAYREGYRYVNEVMRSPGYGVVNWAIDRDTHRPLVETDWDGGTNWLNANAPLDDLRVVRGLLFGARLGVPEAAVLGDSILRGLYWTTVTDRDRDAIVDFPAYAGGLLGFAWDWAETDDPSLAPPARATGIGRLTMDLIPIDYQDLYTIALAAERDGRWQGVLDSATDLLLASELGQTGLFYNGYTVDGVFTGDFENQDLPQGTHLKTIQVLWTALHLSRASTRAELDPQRRQRAQAAAARTLAFFANFYATRGRVPEYLRTNGADVPDCVMGAPAGCLVRGDENLFLGEARIYALLARLALWQGDAALAATLIDQEILTDRVAEPADPRYGAIGASTTGEDDAEAWNVLESVLSICQAAGGYDPGSGSAP